MTDVCVVTGAAGGLGALIAERMAKTFTVLCTDVDEAGARAQTERIGGWSVVHDVRDPDAHRAVAAEAATRGQLRVWVNNAGVLSMGADWTLSDEAARQMVEVNLLGVIGGSRAAVKAMPERGTIINIASISSLLPAPGLAVYAATKHAVLGYSTALAGDLRREGRAIDVCCVCPDAMETDMVKRVAHQPEADLLFAGGPFMLTAEATADHVATLVKRPQLVSVLPRHRLPLVHALRPFPAVALRLLDGIAAVGRRFRPAR